MKKKFSYDYYKLRQYRRFRQTLAISARGRDKNSNPSSTPVLQFSIVYVQNSSRDSQATSSSNLREFRGN